MPWEMSYRFYIGDILPMAEMITFLTIFCLEVKEFDDMKDIKWMFSAITAQKDRVPISNRD
jgi:hypothetical protein